MILYKYVDKEHAERFASGSIRIGTFASYANLESSRRDTKEGRDSRYIPTFNKDDIDGNYDLIENLRRSGIDIRGATFNHLSIKDNTFSYIHPPIYLFCTSTNPTPSILFAKPQALFQINSARHVANLITRNNSSKLGMRQSLHVSYTKRQMDWKDRGVENSPFIKYPQFHEEKEYRFCWNPIGESVESFCTEPNDEVAKYITRIF